MNWETLLCFGDSITLGARSYLGYPELCGNILSEKLNKSWNVINHATNGFTTIDLIRSIDTSWANLKIHYPSLITIMIGTNDVKNNSTTENFSAAYCSLLTKAKLLAANNNILLIKIPRLAQNVFYPYNFSMNDRVKEFNSEIEKLALKNNLRLLDFIFDNNDFFDGVHLNEKGSLVAAQQLSQFILTDKGF